MEKSDERVFEAGFEAGELYLFHRNDASCPAESSLWGVYDKHTERGIVLESCSLGLYDFRYRELLPAEYRYRRLSTRSELRDYTCNLAWWEARRKH